jgi:hypothetical protein
MNDNPETVSKNKMIQTIKTIACLQLTKIGSIFNKHKAHK